MENSFQTSFIPKKPMTSNVSEKEPRNFFSIITTFLLVVSILISVGLFVYKIYLTKQKETLSSSLAITRDSFEKDTIDELELFDKRTESAKQILSNHIVLSPMFALLGEITIPSIQYTNFEQKTDEKGFLVNIEGMARDYRSIALQADMFNSVKGRSFKNVLFSNLMKDKNNNISFNLKFNVELDLLSYEKNDLLEQTNPLSQDLGNQTQ
ncbi:MAG: hypothetical protein WC839_04485 [Candidatus Paceibacterota bacterium]